MLNDANPPQNENQKKSISPTATATFSSAQASALKRPVGVLCATAAKRLTPFIDESLKSEEQGVNVKLKGYANCG